MKKAFTRIIALSLLLFTLAGCGTSHKYTSATTTGGKGGQVELSLEEGSGYKQKAVNSASVQITKDGQVYLEGTFIEGYPWDTAKDLYVRTERMNDPEKEETSTKSPTGIFDVVDMLPDATDNTDTDKYNRYTSDGNEYIPMIENGTSSFLVKIAGTNICALFVSTKTEDAAQAAFDAVILKAA